MTEQDSQSGFTLIEALVAMAVLALGAVSLLTATEGHSARISALTDRTAARWAGEYALTAARLGLDTTSPADMLGRSMAVTVGFAATDDPDLQAIEVAVAPGDITMSDSGATTLYRLTGYRVLRNE